MNAARALVPTATVTNATDTNALTAPLVEAGALAAALRVLLEGQQSALGALRQRIARLEQKLLDLGIDPNDL